MEHPFQRWVDAARPRAQLWRTALGAVIVVGVWFGWTQLALKQAVNSGITSRDALAAVMQLEPPKASLTYVEVAVATGVLFATFWGLWFGVWAVVRFLSKRALMSVISHDRHVRAGQFLIGMLLAGGYVVAGLVLSSFSGVALHRTSVPIDAWLTALAPLVLLIFLQSAGEELFFRGYLTQQLAARVRHPLVWGLLPALMFGIGHASNRGGDIQFAVYYVFAAAMLGLIMTATVWRTGGLAVAMGFHLVNNIGAILVVGVAGTAPPVALFEISLRDALGSAPTDMLILGVLLAFVLSPYAPLPKGQPLRRNDTRAAP